MSGPANQCQSDTGRLEVVRRYSSQGSRDGAVIAGATDDIDGVMLAVGAGDAEGPQIHDNNRLELVSVTRDVLILIGIIVVTIATVPSIAASLKPGDPVAEVAVDGYHYYWNYTYPNGVIVVNELRVPVEVTMALTLRSPDVVHSWWVPDLVSKRDAVPGSFATLNFKPDAEETYA